MVWADNDPMTPATMNNPALSSLTIGSGDTVVAATHLSVQSNFAALASRPVALVQASASAGESGSLQALEAYNKTTHASGTTAPLSLGLIGNSEHSGAGHVTEVRASVAGCCCPVR